MTNDICDSPIRSLLLPMLGWLLFASGAPADVSEPWRSTLYPENWQRPGESVAFYDDKLLQDFSFAGYKRGEEPIPNVAGPVFDVTDYGAIPNGGADSTMAIQNAINAAANAGGGVVFLPAGEFRVSPQGTNNFCVRINSSNIVLRGAGTAGDGTFLLNTSTDMRGKAVVQISPNSVSTGTARNIPADLPDQPDLPGPTRRIPVENAGSFTPGGFVRIEWEFTDAWIIEHAQQTWWNATNGRPSNARYLRQVLATNPAEGWIEVDVPTRYTINPRDNARVIPLSGLLSNVGVESLSIGNLQHPGTTWGSSDYEDPTKPAYSVHNSWLIRMQNTRDSWITDVHSRQAAANTSTCHMLSNGISVLNSFRISLRDCEMRRSQYGGGGGNGYMFRVQHSNECLLERCIADFSRHGIVISHAGTSGNVFHQCEDRETQRSTGHTGSYDTGASGSDNHMHFSHSNLFDQCRAHNSYFTAHHRTFSGTTPHGLTSAHGVYWNTSGSGTRGGNLVRSEQARYGYVIGTSGSRSGASNPTGGNTAPADHLEGIGSGATLEPASLYLDQLSRRLEPTLIYHANGATSGPAPVDANNPYQPSGTVTILGAGDLVRTGFQFTGWNTTPDGSGTNHAVGSTFEITGSTILYAQWTGETYTVTFDANGGSPADPANMVVGFGEPYGSLATTSRPGFSFGGWFTALTGGDPVTPSTTVTIAKDHTIYARWSAPPVVDAGPDQTVAINEQGLWSPAQITAAAWYDASDTISIQASGGAVTQWRDKSGNNNHLSQNEPARQPTTGSSAINGLNVLDFSQDYIFTSTGLGANIQSVFMVHANNAAITSTTPSMILLSTAGGGISTGDGYGSSTGAFVGEVLSVFDENTTAFSKRQAASSSTLPSIDAGAHLYTYALGADWFIGLDGSDDLRDLSSGTGRNPMLFENSFSIGAGARQHPDTVQFFYDGSVAEVILLATRVSQEERQTTEGYLAHKWGLAENLPAGHPYKAAAPEAPSAVAILNGSASDPENDPLVHTWSVVSGPGPVIFSNASALQTSATFPVVGEYTLRLTSDDGFGSSFDDVVITVVPEASFFVTYEGNGGTGGTVPDDAASPYGWGEMVTVLGAGDLARTGHTFVGWNASADGTGTDYAPGATFSAYDSVTLYAKWIPNTYTVSFDANGGSPADPAGMQVTFSANYGTLAGTNRMDFSFVGWFTAPTGGSQVTADTFVSTAGDHALYAQWNALPEVDAGPDQSIALNELIPWSPAEITTAAWYDAADAGTITASGGEVAEWQDKSGNNNHASQGTAEVRPASGSATIGGLNAISFRVGDGTNRQFLSASNHASLNLDSSGGVNVFGVFRYLGFVDNGSAGLNVPISKGQILTANASYGIRVGNNEVLAYRSGLNAQPGAGSGFIGQNLVFSGTRNDTTRTGFIHVDGAFQNSVSQESAIASDNSDPLYIGRDPSAVRYADVDFGEILVVGGTLSDQERQQIEGYLAHKWALAGNLPAEHPYKTTAPGSFVAIATLNGTATDAEDDALTHAWSLESGPAAVGFANPSALETTATFTEKGIYILRLTTSDGLGSSYDDMAVTVGDIIVPSAFEVWAGGGEVTFTGDANNDGVADGLAFLLGAANPSENALHRLPTVTQSGGGLVLTFSMLNAAHRGGASLNLQYSNDLGSSHAWTSVAVPDTSGGPMDGVTFTITPGDPLNSVQATIESSEAEVGQLFGRLQAQNP